MARTTRPPAPPGGPAHGTARRLLGAAAALSLVTAATAVAGTGTAAADGGHAARAAHHPKVLTVAVAQSVDSWNPFTAITLTSTSILRMMYDNLTAYAPKDYHAIGGLADSWKTSKDKKTWTYHIRKGVTWTDGKPVTARDVEFTFTKMMTDSAAATANGNFVENFAKVTAPNDRTVSVRLKKPQATMLALDIPIVPAHVWKHVHNYADFTNAKKFPVVGDGPFVLTGYKPDQYIKLSANKHYWRGAPKFDQIVYKYYKDTDAAVEALQKGEVGFVSDLTPAQTRALQGRKNVTVNKASGKRFYSLAVNGGARTRSGKHFGDANPALRNKDVRWALDYAIDKKTLLKKAGGGIGELGAGYIPKRFTDWHWNAPDRDVRHYDPKKAGALLDRAGYRKGAGGLRRGPDGRPLKIRLLGHNDKPQDKQSATYIKEWLNEIGITVSTSFVDSAGYSAKLTTGNWDLAYDGWTVNPDPDYVLGIHRCADLPDKPGASSPTDMFYCSKEFDKLYDQQLGEYDKAARQRVVRRIQQLFHDDGYMIQLYYPGMVEAYRSDQVTGMQKQPDPGGNIDHQDGMWGWLTATPVASHGVSDTVAGRRTVYGIAGLLAACALCAAAVSRHRRASEDDRP